MAVILDYLSFLKFLNGENSIPPWISLYTYYRAVMKKKISQNKARTMNVHLIFNTSIGRNYSFGLHIFFGDTWSLKASKLELCGSIFFYVTVLRTPSWILFSKRCLKIFLEAPPCLVCC